MILPLLSFLALKNILEDTYYEVEQRDTDRGEAFPAAIRFTEGIRYFSFPGLW